MPPFFQYTPGRRATPGPMDYQYVNPEMDLLRQQQGFADRRLPQEQGFAGVQAALDRQNQTGLAGIGAETARRGQDIGLQGTQIQADTARRAQDTQLEAARLPFDFRREQLGRFGDNINTAISRAGNTIGGGGFNPAAWAGAVERPTGGAPESVLGPQLLQQQVNAARAGNDASGFARSQAIRSDLGGRGYGANSPLLKALLSGVGTGTAASNADQEREIRLAASKLNTDQATSAAQLRQQQYESYQNALQGRERNFLGFQSDQSRNATALLQALTGLLG